MNTDKTNFLGPFLIRVYPWLSSLLRREVEALDYDARFFAAGVGIV
jgi:hypothetical protein